MIVIPVRSDSPNTFCRYLVNPVALEVHIWVGVKTVAMGCYVLAKLPTLKAPDRINPTTRSGWSTYIKQSQKSICYILVQLTLWLKHSGGR